MSEVQVEEERRLSTMRVSFNKPFNTSLSRGNCTIFDTALSCIKYIYQPPLLMIRFSMTSFDVEYYSFVYWSLFKL